uniref:Ras-associating domain-containing protein n=1 Tax=Knipowitschia caucasica TaxID=637954 RepID=A0AAV2MPK9_KNICA
MSLLSSLQPPHRAEKRCFGKLDTRKSDGSQQSEPSTENAVTRQPCKSRIQNQRFSRVFRRIPTSGPASSSVSGSGSRPMSRPVSMASGLRVSLSNPSRKASNVSMSMTGEDPSELSNHVTAPGVLKIFGSEICQGAHYKSVLATTQSSAKELVKEALERYGLTKEEADSFVLCDTIGSVCEHHWQTEAFRVVGDNEKPLLLQSLWKPREGLARRFEIQKRSSVEERASREKDTVTAGINAQARKLQKSRSRVASSLSQRSGSSLWRSRSSTNMPLCSSPHSPDTSPGQRCIQESTGSSAITEAPCEQGAGTELEEKEETESCGDRGSQYSIHPPHDCPYLLLLKGHSQTQDFIIYLLSDPIVRVGRTSDPSTDLRAEVMLWATDILPVHCQFQRGQSGGPTVLSPSPGATVLLNGERLSADATLSSGDVIGLGHSYLFVFKEPPTPVARYADESGWDRNI